ncbi:MAG: AI-2E family transporter [Oscillospiraceae bacterium]|nr:AI-2E family transporter [Oscillospiraceae bacterium]
MRVQSKLLKYFLFAAGILLFIKVLFDFTSISNIISSGFHIIQPFVVGFVIAYCINIPCTWLENRIKRIKFKWVKKIARTVSILVMLAVTIAFFTLGLMLLIPMIYDNARQLFMFLPQYIENAFDAAKTLPFANELNLDVWLESVVEDQPWMDWLPSVGDVGGVAVSFFSGIFRALLTIVSTVYFLVEYNKIKEFLLRLVRAHFTKKKRAVLKYVFLIDTSFRKFLSSQFLDCLILGSIVMLEFTIIGTEYAIVLGILAGVLNIIPYFGSIFASVVAVFIIWAEMGLNTAIITAIVLLITQQLDGNFINPKIMGTSFKVSPVLVIIGITVGGAIGGVPGMILAIPVVNVLKTVLEEYIQTKEKKRANEGVNEQMTIPVEEKPPS